MVSAIQSFVKYTSPRKCGLEIFPDDVYEYKTVL